MPPDNSAIRSFFFKSRKMKRRGVELEVRVRVRLLGDWLPGCWARLVLRKSSETKLTMMIQQGWSRMFSLALTKLMVVTH